MRRLPLLIVLCLAAFLAFGVLAERHMSAGARRMDALLRQVEGELRGDRAESALVLLRRLETTWKKADRTWALITDHHEIDQVYLAIDRTDRLIAFDRLPEAQAEIAALRFLITHIPVKESFRFKSVI